MVVVVVVVVVVGGVCRLGDNLRFLLSGLPSSSFEMRSVIGTDLTRLPDYFSSEPLGFYCLCLSSTGVTSVHHSIQIFMWALEVISSPSIFQGSRFIDEKFPPNLIFIFLLTEVHLVMG